MTETSAPAAPAAVKVTVPVTFTVGPLAQVGLVLQQGWITADRLGDGDSELEYSLTCGAGVGNPLMRAMLSGAGDTTYIAETDISAAAEQLFNMLTGYAGTGVAQDPLGDVIRAARDLMKVIDSGNKSMLGVPAHRLRDALDALTGAGLDDF